MSNAAQVLAFRGVLKSARQGAGYTLADVVDELATADIEVSLDTVTAWEAGGQAPQRWERPVVEALENALGVPGVMVEALGWPSAAA